MASEIIGFDTGTEAGSNWSNDSNAWDGNDSTYATRNVAKASTETTKWIKATSQDLTCSLSNIKKVEIGVRASSADSDDIDIYVIPIFGGTTDGNTYVQTDVYSATTYWFDITSDSNAPSTWTQSDIEGLDIKVFGANTNFMNAYNLYIHEFYIRVTEPGSIFYRKNSTTYECELSLNESNILRPVGIQIDGDKNYGQLVATDSTDASDLRCRYYGETYAFSEYINTDAETYEVGYHGTEYNGCGFNVGDILYLNKVSITQTGFVTKLRIHRNNGGEDTLKAVIADSTGGIVAISPSFTTPDEPVIYIPFGDEIILTTGNDYYLAYIGDGSNVRWSRRDVAGGGGYISSDFDNIVDFDVGDILYTVYEYNIGTYLKKEI
jgi:hypothetical protein